MNVSHNLGLDHVHDNPHGEAGNRFLNVVTGQKVLQVPLMGLSEVVPSCASHVLPETCSTYCAVRGIPDASRLCDGERETRTFTIALGPNKCNLLYHQNDQPDDGLSRVRTDKPHRRHKRVVFGDQMLQKCPSVVGVLATVADRI